MPRKPRENKNLTPQQVLKNICESAHGAAYRGQICHDKETLMEKYNYSNDQADVYIFAFNKKAGTSEIQAIRKAVQDARVAAAHGQTCPTEDELKSKNSYNEAQIKAYIKKFKLLERSADVRGIKKARKAAQAKALDGRSCHTIEALKTKGYSDKEIAAYFNAYQASCGTQEKQAQRRARTDGRVSATYRRDCPLESDLKKRGYTHEQIQAYQQGYKTASANKSKRADTKAETFHTKTEEANDNGLFFSFNSQAPVLLPHASLPPLFQELDELETQETVRLFELN